MRAPIILILAALLALALQLSLGRGYEAAPDAAVQVRRAHSQPTAAAAPLLRTPVAFSGERSPFDTLRPGAPTSEAGADTFSLVGVVRSGASASAIVRDPAGASHVLRPGDTLQGWTLEGVGRDDAALARGTDRRTLTLNGPPAVLNRTPS